MKDYYTILEKKNANILITGDSIAYNRYSYDATPRANAYNCGIGMESWSFSLRDRILTSAPQFIYGDELKFDCPTVLGIANHSEVPNTAMFQGRIQTLYPKKDICFEVPIQNDEIILYLQRRIDSPCTFDILVDGKLTVKDIDTSGNMEDFAGYGLLPLILPCDASYRTHKVFFTNIRGTTPVITVAAAASRYTNIVLNGKGSEPVSYFLDHYEERIAKHQPDLILMTLSANDRIRIAPEVLRLHLIELFAKIFHDFPYCKLLFILPPSSHNTGDPFLDVSPYTSIQTEESYNRTIKRVCERLGKAPYDGFGTNEAADYDIDLLDTPSLFEHEPPKTWRFDNIHLNRHGNEVLYHALINKFGFTT